MTRRLELVRGAPRHFDVLSTARAPRPAPRLSLPLALILGALAWTVLALAGVGVYALVEGRL